MREILISTESGSDLPPEVVEQYGFYVRPMHVIMDGLSREDGSFPVDEVYEYYERTKRVPSTSAVNPEEYERFWTQLRNDHPDSVIFHFTYSSKASSTHQSAMVAVKNFEDIHIIDTKQVSGGCTAHMIACHDLICKKEADVTDYEALADECRALADDAVCHFIPGTLEYLRAGGRVSNAAYLGASILQLKPLIEMEDGKLVTTKKYRGSMGRILDRFMRDFTTKYKLKKDCLYLMYSKGLDRNTFDRMKEIALSMGFLKTIYVMTGCVISCHGGKGAIGLAGMLDR